MNLENKTAGAGKWIAGCLLGILLAAVSPIAILTELMSLLVVVQLPAIGMMLLYRWVGVGPAALSAVLQMAFTARLFGSTFMWMSFLSSILPLIILLRVAQKPFFTQMQVSIAAFGGGTVASVVALYSAYGGNMVQRFMEQLPQAMRTLPAEALQAPMETLSAALGREFTLESFYALFDDAIVRLIPYYQMELPGLLFSGALITAVFCAAIGAWMHVRRNGAPQACFVSLRDWYLPASTTGGLLTMGIASYVIYAMGMQQGQTLYTAVYSIVLTAFTIQALASMARYLQEGKLRPGVQRAILIVVGCLCLMGGSLYFAIYGLASALFGRKGALRQKITEHQEKNNHHSDEE